LGFHEFLPKALFKKVHGDQRLISALLKTIFEVEYCQVMYLHILKIAVLIVKDCYNL